MSTMGTAIGRIVSEDVSIRVTQLDVLYELITNAIQANATKITCTLHSTDRPLEEEQIEVVKRKVDSVTIVDNGDGFTDKNYKSFCTYRTEHNMALGCKGVGRLVFLKVFEKITFESHVVDVQEVRSFKFDLNFDTDNWKKETIAVESNSTKVELSKITQQYFNPERHVDRRIEVNLESIREKVLLHLIPTLFFYKKKGVKIDISFVDALDSSSIGISSDDVPDFDERKFNIADRQNNSFDFTLNFKVYEEKGKLNAFFCADNRTVCEFAEKDFRLSLPYGYSGFFLLESDYLRERVNNERNDFDIFPVKTDMYSTVSWETINTKLKSEISQIVKAGIPETEKINREKLQAIQNERPYLVEYIDEDDIEMAGFLDKTQIIEKAKKRFDVAKEKVFSSAGKDSFTDQELNDAIAIAQNELVSYVNDRAQVLERLRTLVDKQERVESVIHNLFMEKRTDDDYFYIGKNNLWLIDDRFTTYSYAASDKRVKEILAGIDEITDEVENLNDRPDLSLFFSHNPNNPESLKSVLIEIKSFGFISKPDREKFHGISQLVDYIQAFKEKEKIDEIVGFLVTDVDDKLAKRLLIDGYKPLYSHEAPIYHRFFEELGTSIYVLSAKTLIIDAEARNKVFLDIIRRQSKLNNLLARTLEASSTVS